VAQKPDAPIRISFSALPELKARDQATTTIRFEAETDLERVDVSIVSEGLEIVSERKTITFSRLAPGALRDLPVTVRLIDPEQGFLFVSAEVTYAGNKRTKNAALPVGKARQVVTREGVGLDEVLSSLTFLNSGGGTAVIRFGKKPFELVSVGDKLGKNKAEVKAIEAGRLVLEENFIGPDGKPNKAEI